MKQNKKPGKFSQVKEALNNSVNRVKRASIPAKYVKQYQILDDILFNADDDEHILTLSRIIKEEFENVKRALVVLREIPNKSACGFSYDEYLSLIVSMSRYDIRLTLDDLIKRSRQLITSDYNKFLTEKDKLYGL